MPWIAGGLKPTTTPSLKLAFIADRDGARLRASCLGSRRCDQSFRVTKEMPELVLSARDSKSKPEKVTAWATAGFFITPSLAAAEFSRVREIEAAGGSAVTRKT